MKTLFSTLILLGCTTLAAAEPLSLAQCLQLAKQNNPDLNSAQYTTAVAASGVKVARGGYFPQVDLRAGYTVLKDAQAVVIGGMTEPTQEDQFPFAGIKIEQTLYDFGHTGKQVEQAEALAAAATEDVRDITQDVLLRTVAAYYLVLETEQLQLAARQEETLVTDHLRIARELFTQGVVTRNDVLQAEVELAGSRQRHLKRSSDLENAWLQLNYLTGREATERGELEITSTTTYVAPGPEELSRSLEEIPVLQAGRWRLAAQQAATSANRSALRPTLFAEGHVDYLENRYVEQQTMYAATLGLKFNLFDGQIRRSRLAASHARELREQALFNALEKKAALAYRVADNDRQVASKRLDETREAITQAEENLRINRDRYRNQVGTASEVLEAQTLLTRTRAEHARAEYDYQISLARLQRALGTLGDEQ